MIPPGLDLLVIFEGPIQTDIIDQNYGPRGLFIEGRLTVLLSSTDLHCGWCDSDFTWFGPNGNVPSRSSHAKAMEMGINLLMYAMSH